MVPSHLALLLQADDTAPAVASQSMSLLEFTLGLVEALAWPLAVFVTALIFKKQIIDLAQAVRRIRLGQLEADLERVRDEAVATITQLRSLALALASPAASSLPGMISHGSTFSFSSPPVHERLAQAHAVVEALVSLGIDKFEAETIMLKPIKEHIRSAHIDIVKYIAREYMRSKSSDGTKIDYASLSSAMDRLKTREVSVSETKEVLASLMDGLPPDEEFEARLADLEHFDSTGRIRRPEVAPWSDTEE